MKFRTEIEMNPLGVRIDHSMKGLSLGSCFAEQIASRMVRSKFPLAVNPFGVLFNPISILRAIDILEQGRVFTRDDLSEQGRLWSSFAFHGSFSSTDPAIALRQMNESVRCGAQRLREADYVILTFGTAWVYELSQDMPGAAAGDVAANCHKYPSDFFRRRRLGPDEIAPAYLKLLNGPLKNKQVIFTVSPVRHLADGFAGNSVSKGALLLAIDQLVAKCDNASYFPSFEIMNDDLRDYRFYDNDMVHPSVQAVNYIWEKFSQAAFSPQTMNLIESIEKIADAVNHRPFNPEAKPHRDFLRSMLEKTTALASKHPHIDFSAELDYFSGRQSK